MYEEWAEVVKKRRKRKRVREKERKLELLKLITISMRMSMRMLINNASNAVDMRYYFKNAYMQLIKYLKKNRKIQMYQKHVNKIKRKQLDVQNYEKFIKTHTQTT